MQSASPPESVFARSSLGHKIRLDKEDAWVLDHSVHVQFLSSDTPRVQISLPPARLLYLSVALAEFHNLEIPEGFVWVPDTDPFDFRKDSLLLLEFREHLCRKIGPKPGHKYFGVSLCARSKSWRARLQNKGKTFESAGFLTSQAAALEYDLLALRHRGESANLNFPERRTELLLHLATREVERKPRNGKRRKRGH